MTWEPILDGELAERAWSAVRDVADSFAELDKPCIDLAIFWSYVSNALDDARTAERTDAALTRFAREIERGHHGVRLHGGLAGVGWAAAHISDDVEELLDTIDVVLLRAMDVETWTGSYDLISGLVGLAVYFLERGSAGREGLARIVDHLVATSERTDEGVTWHTRAELLPEHQRVEAPRGYYNCGLAHGVPGVLSILGRIAQRHDAPSGVAALRDDTARWLLAQRTDRGWPATIADARPARARTAWCYGDPGVVVAMWDHEIRAGRSTDALAPFNAWMQQSPEQSGVIDTPLCHGAGGLAHICNRFYQATGVREYRDAAITWFTRALDMRRAQPFAGFPSFNPLETPQWRASAHLIDGACGVALSLLSAVTSIEPEWDRLLLCDLPVRSPRYAIADDS